jgi:hypothetical protein
MTGAQFEIRMRSYRDRRDFAVEAATSPDQGSPEFASKPDALQHTTPECQDSQRVPH